MYYVYIVRCRDGSHYTGLAADLARRYREHTSCAAACARYTRSHRVVALDAAWQTDDRPSAARLEALIKRLPKAKKLQLIGAPQELSLLFGEKLKGAVYQPLDAAQLYEISQL